MWRQLDLYLSARMLLPWLPVLITWQAGKPLTPQHFGILSIVLAARLLVDGALSGVRQICFGIVPLIGGVLVLADATASNPWAFGLIYYLASGLGTTLTAVSDLRGRR